MAFRATGPAGPPATGLPFSVKVTVPFAPTGLLFRSVTLAVKLTESPVKEGLPLVCSAVDVPTGATNVTKLPVIVVGAAGMVKFALNELFESNVPPFELVQLENAKPVFGVASRGMDAFAV